MRAPQLSLLTEEEVCVHAVRLVDANVLEVEDSEPQRRIEKARPLIGRDHSHHLWRSPLPSLRRTYLVDPASSHMLVSKTKPCMSKYKCYTAKLRMAH